MTARPSPIIIPTARTFNLAATARFLRYTEAEIVDTFDGDRYRRALHLPSASSAQHLHVITVEASPGSFSLHLTLTPSAGKTTNMQAAALIESMFSTRHDLREFRRLTKDDATLGAVEKAHRGLHLPCWASLFESLTISILLQQISTAVAIRLKQRFVERFGESVTTNDRTFFAFPSPERIARAEHAELRALGLSGSKAQSIIELARLIAANPRISDYLAREDNETIINRLTALRGIGRWTAEWALMLHFGRTDVFPAGDLALRAMVSKYYLNGEQATERALREFARSRWGAWASYACIYLFAGLRSGFVTLERTAAARVVSSTRPRRTTRADD